MDLFFFLLFAFIAVLCAVSVVLQKHPISCALSLVGTMASLAVLYLLLGAEFIAMVQVIVYAGAIMVLFVFVIMLLNAGAEDAKGRSWVARIAGLPALATLAGVLGLFMLTMLPMTGAKASFVKFGDFTGGGAKEIGTALFTEYLLPFEVTSILILIAILGAIVLARKEID
jgi:NADH-quinone oxidoreductase subunit J